MLQLRDVADVALRMREVLEDANATLLGSNTGGSEWKLSSASSTVRSLIFTIISSKPEQASRLAEDRRLSVLFSLLRSILRCARLVLRILRQLLLRRSLTKLPASLFYPPAESGGDGGNAAHLAGS